MTPLVWQADAGADVAQQRILTSEGGLPGLAAEAGAVVRDDRDWRRDNIDDLTGGLGDDSA